MTDPAPMVIDFSRRAAMLPGMNQKPSAAIGSPDTAGNAGVFLPAIMVRTAAWILSLLGACLIFAPARAQVPAAAPAPTPLTAKAKVIHAFVALCDNESQGIAKVPPKIGNGDDPANNLYWGCDDGLRSVFSKSKDWKRLDARDPDGDGPILERLVFQHRASGARLVADAYRGREIRRCLTDYFAALSGNFAVTAETADAKFEAGGSADLIAYLGHDGLMEFQVPFPEPSAAARQSPKTAIALCCISRSYFAPGLEKTGAKPLLMTTQLMYPAAQLLRESAAGWLAGANGEACRQRAAAAYAANQKISKKAAAGVFWTGM